MSMSASLINLICLDKESLTHQESMIPSNWNYLFERLGNTTHFSEFNQTYFFSIYG